MRQITLLLFFYLFLTEFSFGQYESKKAYAGFSIGPSIPIKDYGSTDILLESSAFAKTGVALNLNFAYRIASNFGVMAMILIQVNSFDDQALFNELRDNSKTLGTTSSTVFTSVEADSWMLSGINVGVFASVPIGSSGKYILEPRIMGSLLTAISPRIKITTKEGVRTEYLEQQTGAGAAFGYTLGGTFRYNISDHMALLFNADYLKVNPKFFDVEYQQSNGYTYYRSFQQKIEVINVTLGFAFRFKKDLPPVRRTR